MFLATSLSMISPTLIDVATLCHAFFRTTHVVMLR